MENNNVKQETLFPEYDDLSYEQHVKVLQEKIEKQEETINKLKENLAKYEELLMKCFNTLEKLKELVVTYESTTKIAKKEIEEVIK